MSTFKEFQAKSVDQAILEACRFFAVERQALDIEIISGGSSGIFGLGARKAVIRAARRRLTPVREDIPETVAAVPEQETPAAQASVDVASAEEPDHVGGLDAEEVLDDVVDYEDEDEERPVVALSAEERAGLEAEIRRIVTSLLRPIADGARLTIDVAGSPVMVHIEAGENSGLIIGRDGQTITALQYLANRIVSKTWPRTPRIQLDAGDYRQKQEEQLLGVAQFLSEKAKKS